MNPTTKKRTHPGLTNIATLLVGSAMLGQGLGFLRTKLVNGNFPLTGPGSTDSYFAAFNIPDFFFFTLAAGALGVAFMPVLADRLHKGDKRGMWEISTSLLNLLVMVMFVVGVLIFIFAEPMVHYIISPNLTPQQLHNTVTIMRFLAFNPLLFTISGVLTATQQALGRFFFYALAPMFYNALIIASIFIFRHNIGIIGLGIGALCGAVLQLAVVCTGLFGTNFHWSPKILWRSADFKTVLRQLPPRSLDQGIDQVESIVETHFARRLGTGNISFYANAYVLATAPTFLIGTAISTAAFPQMNNRLSQGRPDLFRKEFLQVVRAMIWVAMPVAVICFYTRGYLARIIFTNASNNIATIFGFLTVFIFFAVLYTIISRWFYSHKDTITPLCVSVIIIIINITLVTFLARPAPHGYGVSGLAISQSLSAMLEVFTLSIIMVKRDHKLLDLKFLYGLVKIISVTGFSVVAGFIMVQLFPLELKDRGVIALGSKLSLIAGVTGLVYLTMSVLFGLEEAKSILAKLKKIALKPIRFGY
ncbi:MAG TPA: lipid II flippase MurJ [Candidatus Saccharimonadales bacterium]|jgi:putative peptidoglycan lipid II flippase|nr:lipid II flippase MurJ [Candidatus Saccharimonadales bacterium]